MIASLRGLVALAVIAAALLVFVIVDAPRKTAAVDRALVPGFVAEEVTHLQWTAHPMGPYLGLERSGGGAWKRTLPAPGVVEQAPIANLLAALRGARWHRAEQRALTGAVIHLRVGSDELWISTPTAEQAWIQRGGAAYLVDAWVARALLPSPLALAITRPLAQIGEAPFTVSGITVEGPRIRTPDGVVLGEPALLEEVTRVLVELDIESLPAQPIADADGMGIAAAGITARLAPSPACAPRVGLRTSVGDGCVAAARADAALAAVARLAAPARNIAARAPSPLRLAQLVLADGETLDLRKRPTLAGTAVDDDALAELRAVLRAPAAIVAVPTTPPTGVLVAELASGGELRLALHPGNVVRRDGEPIALRLTPAAFAILMRPSTAYRDLTPWREDAASVTRVVIDGTVWQRGAALGEWTRAGVPVASIDGFVETLATPRAIVAAPTTFATTHRVELVVQPPVGDVITHVIEFGARAAVGCPARLDGSAVVLPAEVCGRIPR